MRFRQIQAESFGALEGERLELEGGMNVISGPNESGKSTWHAAIYAGLCGMRRTRGSRTVEDREFREQHRPWDGREWQVGATVELDDGSRYELKQDLEQRLGTVHDLTVGREITERLIREGAPDGSSWLGLDRSTFAATVCVRQADVLAVAERASALQHQLQRAAATATDDSTAALALERIATFAREHVGLDRTNSTRPLRAAIDRQRVARAQLDTALAGHHSQEDLARRLSEAKARADQDGVALHELRAAHSVQFFEQTRDRVSRIEEGIARFPDGEPVSAAASIDLRERVAAALKMYDERPALMPLTGSSSDEIQTELDALPEAPTGDTRPHDTVVEAARVLDHAKQRLGDHGASEPPTPMNAVPTMDPERLHELAGALERELPDTDSQLDRKILDLDGRLQNVEASARKKRGLAIGLATTAVVTVIGALLLHPAVFVVTVASAAAAVWLWTRNHAVERASILDRLRGLERECGAQRTRRQDAEAALIETHKELQTRGLPANPEELRDLARQQSSIESERRKHSEGAARRKELTRNVAEARDALAAALAGRGCSSVNSDTLNDELASYRRRCQEREQLAREAGRRPSLATRIDDRRSAEAALQRAEDRCKKALAGIRSVAEECQLSFIDPDELADALRTWRAKQEKHQDLHEARRKEWIELQHVLDRRSLEEHQREVAELEAEASKARLGVTPDRIAVFVNHPELAERLREQSEKCAAHERTIAHLQGQLETQVIPDVAEAEEELGSADADLARVRRLAHILERTEEFLTAAQDRVHRDIAPILQATIEPWLPRITEGRYHEATVDPQSLDVKIRRTGGTWRSVGLLSQGVREQVYLLLRAAMAQHLATTGESCPLILDDVLVQCDRTRKQAILELLHEISRDRQVILFSQEESVRDWAEVHVQGEEDRLVLIDPIESRGEAAKESESAA